jgi:hypothetical protein
MYVDLSISKLKFLIYVYERESMSEIRPINILGLYSIIFIKNKIPISSSCIILFENSMINSVVNIIEFEFTDL